MQDGQSWPDGWWGWRIIRPEPEPRVPPAKRPPEPEPSMPEGTPPEVTPPPDEGEGGNNDKRDSALDRDVRPGAED